MNKELEEAIERLNRFSHITVLYSNTFAMTTQSLKELQQDIAILLHAVKNSIPTSVVEEKIEELKDVGKIINQTFPDVGEYIHHEEIKVLQELLQDNKKEV